MKALKRVWHFLQKNDALWSFPLTVFIFFLIGRILVKIFGFAVGTYDMGFFQPVFIAVGVVLIATNFGVLGLYFTFRGFHRYLYGKKTEEGVINKAKTDWKELSVFARFGFAVGIIIYFITAILWIYSKLV